MTKPRPTVSKPTPAEQLLALKRVNRVSEADWQKITELANSLSPENTLETIRELVDCRRILLGRPYPRGVDKHGIAEKQRADRIAKACEALLREVNPKAAEVGEPCGLGRDEAYAELRKLAEESQRENETVQQAFARISTKTEPGRQLFKAAVKVPAPKDAPQDYDFAAVFGHRESPDAKNWLEFIYYLEKLFHRARKISAPVKPPAHNVDAIRDLVWKRLMDLFERTTGKKARVSIDPIQDREYGEIVDFIRAFSRSVPGSPIPDAGKIRAVERKYRRKK